VTFSRQAMFLEPTLKETQQPHIRAAFASAGARCGQYVRDAEGKLGLLIVKGDWKLDPMYNVDPVKGTPKAAATKQKANGAANGAAGGAAGGAAPKKRVGSAGGWKNGVYTAATPAECAEARAAYLAAGRSGSDDGVAAGAAAPVEAANAHAGSEVVDLTTDSDDDVVEMPAARPRR
jgi:hypothetical protein